VLLSPLESEPQPASRASDAAAIRASNVRLKRFELMPAELYPFAKG
jgi:hypothetical protein